MKYHLIALFTILVWGTTFVSTKVLLQSMSPLWILLLRFAIGFVALCILRPHVLKLDNRRHEALFAAAGASGIAAYYLLENVALVFSTATAVGVIVAASPLFTAIISAFLGDRSSLCVKFFAGFVLAMGGLIVVGIGVEPDDIAVSFKASDYFGDFLALLAALVWAVYSVLVQKLASLGYETVAATKRTFLWGLTFIIPISILFGGNFPSFEIFFQWNNVLNLLFLGVIASAACFVTWGVSVKYLGPTVSTTYIYLVPAITATMSIVILGEPLNIPIVLGVLMTIFGLLLSQERGLAPHAQSSRFL